MNAADREPNILGSRTSGHFRPQGASESSPEGPSRHGAFLVCTFFRSTYTRPKKGFESIQIVTVSHILYLDIWNLSFVFLFHSMAL